MGEQDTRLDEEARAAETDEAAADEAGGDQADVLDLDEEQDLDEVMRAAADAVESAEGHDKADVARLEQELADLRDRSMRTLADFDNYRKRAERERQDAKRFAVMEPMRDLLDVVDNLERAVEASGSVEDLRQGVDMILRQLDDLLKRHGVTAVEAEDQPFDPAVHEAVARRESDEVDEPMVDAEYQKGYLLHDRLLRPARVVVAVPAEEPRAGGEQEDDERDEPAHDEEGGSAS